MATLEQWERRATQLEELRDKLKVDKANRERLEAVQQRVAQLEAEIRAIGGAVPPWAVVVSGGAR